MIEGKYDIKRQKEAPLFKDAMARFLDHTRQHHADHPNTARRYVTSGSQQDSNRVEIRAPDRRTQGPGDQEARGIYDRTADKSDCRRGVRPVDILYVAES